MANKFLKIHCHRRTTNGHLRVGYHPNIIKSLFQTTRAYDEPSNNVSPVRLAANSVAVSAEFTLR